MKENWPYSDSIKVAESLGNKLELKEVEDISYDEVNRVVTVPGYI